MGAKKEVEKKCYDSTKEYVNKYISRKQREYFLSLFPINSLVAVPNERPDFIADSKECSYLIEHFMIDFCYDGPKNNQSQSKRAGRGFHDIFEKYHDPSVGTIKDENLKNATDEIEKAVNSLSNISNQFDYDKFIRRLNEVFKAHRDNIGEYINNNEVNSSNYKVIFLIEFHCETCLLRAHYKGVEVSFAGAKRAFPITRDFIKLFENSKEIDYIILSQFDEGIPTEARDVKIFDTKNIEESICRQKITVYDKVSYLNITRKTVIKLEDNK
ncbi:hypothetical protein SAMN02910339_01365 [Lachnospiraceae bacterium YSD2013]|nr:hypothetical protein SAMN02910339_01365 [Lachnospiraceae bacterium YSD2013]